MKYGVFQDEKINNVFIDIARRLDKLEKRQEDHHSALYNILIDSLLESNDLPDIEILENAKKISDIDDYWNEHTVANIDSMSYSKDIRWVDYIKYEMYPGLVDLLEMGKNHNQEVILDYGCGPGNDLVWYMTHNNLKRVIGIDISLTALKSARFRVGLQKKYNNVKGEISLIKIEDGNNQIPIDDKSVDFVNCQGVLMHTSNPQTILNEFYRVLKPGSKEAFNVTIMVYNKDSVWYHLWAAYVYRFVNDSIKKSINPKDWKDISVDEIFRRSTDGINCPIARCWEEKEFKSMCENAGFQLVEYAGAYLNPWEPEICLKYLDDALSCGDLEEEHKKFLRKIQIDGSGNPVISGKYACVSGVYKLCKY